MTSDDLRPAPLPSALQQVLLHGIRTINEGITIADMRQPDQPLVYVNPGFSRMTGYTSDEVLGKNCRFLQGADTDPAHCRQIREAIAAGRRCRVELLNYRKDYVPFWNRLSMVPIFDAAGALTHYVGIQYDITADQKLKQQDIQYQALQHTMTTVNDIVGNFMNNLLLFRDELEEKTGAGSELLRDFDAAYDSVVDRFHRINQMKQFKTRHYARGV
jgi:PAS domain S-box-containing protein